MSAKLHLRLEQDLRVQSSAQAAVATVYPIGSGSASTQATRQSVVVPAGGPELHEIEVPAGTYLVEALLPSGETVAKEVSVGDGDDETVDLQGKASEHEWLSWQRLVGNVGLSPPYTEAPSARARAPSPAPPRPRGRPRTGGGVVGARAPRPTQGARPAPAPRRAPKARWIADPADPLRGDRTSSDVWPLLVDALGASSRTVLKKLAPRGSAIIKPSDADAEHQLYRLSAEGPVANDGPRGDGGGPIPRRYLLVDEGDWTELVCAPVPWFDQSTGGQAIFEVLVRSRPGPGEAGAATSVIDPNVGTALGYMSIGALPEARKLYDQAKDMLYGKVSNPLAAAGGGYVLLGTEPTGESDDWPEWIENLRRWFPWLPDGSVQAGWLKLKRRRDQADVDEARIAFHEAMNRGLPYYSIGLQRLVEGLTMFEGDPETDRLLELVRAVAWHANLQQPFTTLRMRG